MPNAPAHFVIGSLAGGAISVGLQLHRAVICRDSKFDIGEVFICAGIAGAAAMVPDILEPAITPNHRGFFHSLTMAVLVAYFISGKHTKNWSAKMALLIGVAGFGFLSHLAADATTPKSIRLI